QLPDLSSAPRGQSSMWEYGYPSCNNAGSVDSLSISTTLGRDHVKPVKPILFIFCEFITLFAL
ncbi:MAG: hypothetical protein OQL18_06215, partial [Deltaproteobacteria bacterium]|nr:hypothetical protein [Deltaproteobacteria bacterium]